MAGVSNGRSPPAGLTVIVFPLALGQFICTYAGSSLNVAISPIAHDLHTTVFGIQLPDSDKLDPALEKALRPGAND